MSQIIRDLTEINRCAAQYRAEQMEPLGLKACHASYLTEICAQPGISQDRLAQRICINKSNVARQAAILEEGGFITRHACCDDKRVLRLYPTEKTLSLLPRIREILDRWEECITEGLSAQEQELLAGILSRMRERASGWMEGHEIGPH